MKSEKEHSKDLLLIDSDGFNANLQRIVQQAFSGLAQIKSL